MTPVYKQLGGGQPTNGLFGNAQELIKKFNQFKQTLSGDPKKQVQDLLNSGRMTQAQYNQLQSLANQFQNMLK